MGKKIGNSVRMIATVLALSLSLAAPAYAGDAPEAADGTYAQNVGAAAVQDAAAKKLAAPKLTGVSNAANGIKVTWRKVTGAAKYRVFYKPAGGSWAKAGDATGTSYTWTGAKSGTAYQIRVWCVSADGKTKTSGYDTIKTIRYIAAPNYTVTALPTGEIKLSWGKVTGATRYTVFYKTTGSWKTLSTTGATDYTVKSPKDGAKYTFRVRCVNSAGSVVSGYVADKTIDYKKPPIVKLKAPKITGVSSVAKGIQVTWSKVTGATKYRVFYKPAGGSWAKAGDTTGTSYIWTGAKVGTTYQIRVWCVSADGKTKISDYDVIKTITARGDTSAFEKKAAAAVKSAVQSEYYGAADHNKGGKKYMEWFRDTYAPGSPLPVNWCDRFAVWVWGKIGVRFGYGGTENHIAVLRGHHAWFPSESGYTPISGDMIYFDWDGDGVSDHVGIIHVADKDHVYVLHGNYSGGQVAYTPWNDSYFTGAIIGYGSITEYAFATGQMG